MTVPGMLVVKKKKKIRIIVKPNTKIEPKIWDYAGCGGDRLSSCLKVGLAGEADDVQQRFLS